MLPLPEGNQCDAVLERPFETIIPVEGRTKDMSSRLSDFRRLSQASDKSARHLYQDSMLSLSALYGIEGKLKPALETRIWLKSGGYLVIEPTEALTVIDVNSGKCEDGKNPEDTSAHKAASDP